MYEELVKMLRKHYDEHCPLDRTSGICGGVLANEAADAIEELLKAARAMHTWIFLNTGDEQKAYDECGLSDEINAMLGYGGQFELRAEPPKEET